MLRELYEDEILLVSGGDTEGNQAGNENGSDPGSNGNTFGGFDFNSVDMAVPSAASFLDIGKFIADYLAGKLIDALAGAAIAGIKNMAGQDLSDADLAAAAAKQQAIDDAASAYEGGAYGHGGGGDGSGGSAGGG
jgi:hypothetical protein